MPWTEEPGRLQSMGSPRVGHDRAHTRLSFKAAGQKISAQASKIADPKQVLLRVWFFIYSRPSQPWRQGALKNKTKSTQKPGPTPFQAQSLMVRSGDEPFIAGENRSASLFLTCS